MWALEIGVLCKRSSVLSSPCQNVSKKKNATRLDVFSCPLGEPGATVTEVDLAQQMAHRWKTTASWKVRLLERNGERYLRERYNVESSFRQKLS